MTTQEIIKQTETFTIDQKQQLAYYFLFSTLNEEKKQDFMQLFHYKKDFSQGENIQNKKNEYNLLSVFENWKNKLPVDLIVNDDEFYN